MRICLGEEIGFEPNEANAFLDEVQIKAVEDMKAMEFWVFQNDIELHLASAGRMFSRSPLCWR